MKNLIEIWLLQIGEEFINNETKMKMFAEFNRVFLTILEKNASTEKKLVSNIKKTTSDKPSVTKEILHLVAEKHRYFNDYKLTQSAESFVSFKKYRDLVNRKLKEAQNQFSEDFLRKMKPQKRNESSLKKNRKKTTEIDENVKKELQKINMWLLTEFSAKWASTQGILFHWTSKNRAKVSRVLL